MPESVKTLFTVFPFAVLAGIAIAATCAALGVFVILKRVVFIGITLAEAAACGIAAAMACHINPFAGATACTLATVAILSYPFEARRIPRDAVLGTLFVLASSLSILLVSRSSFGLQEVRAILYGDLILTSERDLWIVLGALLPVLAYVLLFLRPTLYSFLDREGSVVLGLRVAMWELLFFFALGVAVSAASKVAGSLLVFCYLVVAPSVGLVLSRRLGAVLAISMLTATAATMIGLLWSLEYDLPANQTVAVVLCICLAAACVGARMAARRVRRNASAACVPATPTQARAGARARAD